MAKKQKFGLGSILAAVAVLLGVIAIILLAATGASYTLGNTTTTYSCANLTFGYTAESSVKLGLTSISGSQEIFKFSFGNFLAYLLVVVGIVFAVLSILGKLGKIAPLVSVAAFVIAAILFFCMVSMCSPATDNADAVAKIKENLSLGAGAIVSGVFCIIAAVASAAKLVLKK